MSHIVNATTNAPFIECKDMAKNPVIETDQELVLSPKDTPEHLVEEEAISGRKWPWVLASLVLLGFVLTILSQLEDTADVDESTVPPSLQIVSVKQVSASTEKAEVRSYSEVRPRWSAELSASVSGKIVRLHERALAGEPVKAGDLLIEIENSRISAEFAAAELMLKESKLGLLKAENATLLARKDFERNRQKPPNDLALKVPQLEIAESTVLSAEARVKASRKQLEDTRIVAPFDAYVAERHVSPGQTVNPGDRLLKLVDRSAYELIAELGQRDWALLQRPLENRTARILNQDGEEVGEAKVRRGGGFLDEQTRQYKLFLEIKEPNQKTILSGDFVSVILEGVEIENSVDIPSSALTQDGYVWYLNKDNRLQRYEPRVFFRRHDRVIVSPPVDLAELRVATIPLASFLPGQQVKPNIVGE
ncbi:MAG: efflux RND transporter periplasmic adaptor subunit [Pseudomonadota bacterium]